MIYVIPTETAEPLKGEDLTAALGKDFARQDFARQDFARQDFARQDFARKLPYSHMVYHTT